MIPDRIGRFKILSRIGRGGMAVVYLGVDPNMGRKVAIKLMLPQFTLDEQFEERFQNEAKTSGTLEHPAIVPVYEYAYHEEQPYIVMRYMRGGSLRDRIKRKGLTLAETYQILARLSEGLDKAHDMGVIHRDLKPDNILFDEDNNPYLADFGIARLAEATKTMTVIGTPAYMSPEQVDGDLELDRRCDIYALGVIVFEMLTGEQPYKDRSGAKLMVKHLLEPVPSILEANQQLPVETQAIIERAMAKEPADRYPSAAALMADLGRLLSAEPEQEPDSSATTWLEGNTSSNPLYVPERRRPLTWIALVALLVLLGLVLYSGMFADSAPLPMNPRAAQTAEVAVALVEPSLTPTKTPSPRPSDTPVPTNTITPAEEMEIVVAVDVDTPTATTTSPSTWTPSPTVTETPPQLEVILSSANVRSGPGTVYNSIGTVPQGTIARIIARNSDSSWLNVQLEDGRTGWLARSVTDQSVASIVDVTLAATIPARPPATSTVASSATQPPDTQPATDTATTTSDQNSGGGGGGGDSNPQPAPQPTEAKPPPQPTEASP